VFRRSGTIPSPDTRALARARMRTGVVRAGLVVLACALVAAAVFSARGLEPRSNELVPGGRSGVIVLDVSLSIVDRDYARVRALLERMIEADNPMGLVLFSDVAYELTPPRTPAKELKPILRFFTLDDGRLPPNPWTPTFSAGTQISLGLELASDMLERDRVSPASILLISDLNTAPSDLTALRNALDRLRQSDVTVRVVPLSASSDGLALFGGLLGEDAFVDPVEPRSDEPRVVEISLSGETPYALLVVSALVFVALALYERFAGRLALPAGTDWRREA
jgi:von Willebrand factor type A domain